MLPALPVLIALLAPTPVDFVRASVDASSWTPRVIEAPALEALSKRAIRFEWKTPPEFDSLFTRRIVSDRKVTYVGAPDVFARVVISAYHARLEDVCKSLSDPRACATHLGDLRHMASRRGDGRITHDQHVINGREVLYEAKNSIRYLRLVRRGGWAKPALCTVELTPKTVHLLPGLKAACATLDEVVAQE